MNNKSKNELRKWAKELRKTLDFKKLSAYIEAKAKELDTYKKARTVMSYMAGDLEVSLNSLFQDKSKDWFLPVVGARRGVPLQAVPYLPGKTKLIKNKFNILEPEGKVPESHFLDLIFVPGLCFDKLGNRVGFGGGYYDNFLKLNPSSIKVGVCPEECLVDNLPCDIWDQKVDIVITDNVVYSN